MVFFMKFRVIIINEFMIMTRLTLGMSHIDRIISNYLI